ncbi:TPA: replication initiator protein, partial [Streptococcus agalactiae]|nr:replication initiator protein [Streptococcus agalactiae]
ETEKSDLIAEDEEENEREEQEKEVLHRKVDKATLYDKDYIWNLVYSQLRKEKLSQTSADFAMRHFEERYHYALDHMRFAQTSEMVAEYVFNGILAEWNKGIRKQEMGKSS